MEDLQRQKLESHHESRGGGRALSERIQSPVHGTQHSTDLVTARAHGVTTEASQARMHASSPSSVFMLTISLLSVHLLLAPRYTGCSVSTSVSRNGNFGHFDSRDQR